MRLEDIGFYTLSDFRASNVSWESDLQRCELILTDRCNFNCVYCRGIKKDLQGDLTLEQAIEVVDTWVSGNLHNIRFSGGEPTVWPHLLDLVKYTRSHACFEHIALSTNGSASIEVYKELHAAGVNDFSISLDACCASTADAMSRVNSRFDHICQVIRELSKLTYVTVGIVLDSANASDLQKIVEFSCTLGVSDVRIIPSAQSDHFLKIDLNTDLPILKYRIGNVNSGRHVRGIREDDCNKCHLVKDDMAILQDGHFPCIIYMREQGPAIGTVRGKTLKDIRAERKAWFEKTDTSKDPICKKNCLDVCIDHNNRVSELS